MDSLYDSCDSMPNDPVLEAAGEMMALKEIEHRAFESTSAMDSFQSGYTNGFIAGAQFLKTFLRKREYQSLRTKLDKKLSARKQESPDNNRIKPVYDAVQPLESKESDERKQNWIDDIDKPKANETTSTAEQNNRMIYDWIRPAYKEDFPDWVQSLIRRNIIEITGKCDEVMQVNTTKGKTYLRVAETLVYVTDGVGEFIDVLTFSHKLTEPVKNCLMQIDLKPIKCGTIETVSVTEEPCKSK